MHAVQPHEARAHVNKLNIFIQPWDVLYFLFSGDVILLTAGYD